MTKNMEGGLQQPRKSEEYEFSFNLTGFSDVSATSSWLVPAQYKPKRPHVSGIFAEADNTKFNVQFESLMNLLEPRNVINLNEFNQAHPTCIRQFLHAAEIPFSLNLDVETLKRAFQKPDGTYNISKLSHLKRELERKMRDENGPPIRAEREMSQSQDHQPDYCDHTSQGKNEVDIGGDALAYRMYEKMQRIERQLTYILRKS